MVDSSRIHDRPAAAGLYRLIDAAYERRSVAIYGGELTDRLGTFVTESPKGISRARRFGGEASLCPSGSGEHVV